MKQKLNAVVRLLEELGKEGWRYNKARYPLPILESLQRLETDFIHLLKYVELYEEDIAKKKAGEKFNPKNSEIRARLIRRFNIQSIPEEEGFMDEIIKSDEMDSTSSSNQTTQKQ
jgi:hypothetical protein